jgi:hypothetical protein
MKTYYVLLLLILVGAFASAAYAADVAVQAVDTVQPGAIHSGNVAEALPHAAGDTLKDEGASPASDTDGIVMDAPGSAGPTAEEACIDGNCVKDKPESPAKDGQPSEDVTED